MDMYSALKDLQSRVGALEGLEEVSSPEGQATQLAQAHEALVGLEGRTEALEAQGHEQDGRLEVLKRDADRVLANLDEIEARLDAIEARLGAGEEL